MFSVMVLLLFENSDISCYNSNFELNGGIDVWSVRHVLMVYHGWPAHVCWKNVVVCIVIKSYRKSCMRKYTGLWKKKHFALILQNHSLVHITHCCVKYINGNCYWAWFDFKCHRSNKSPPVRPNVAFRLILRPWNRRTGLKSRNYLFSYFLY